MNSESVLKYLTYYHHKRQSLQINNLLKKENKKLCKNLFELGHSVKLDENIIKLRKDLGLARLPPTVIKSKKVLSNFQGILKKTRFYFNDFE